MSEDAETGDLLREVKRRTEVASHGVRDLAKVLTDKLREDAPLGSCEEVTELLAVLEFDTLLSAVRERRDEFTDLAAFVAELPLDDTLGSDMIAELNEKWPLVDDPEIDLGHPFVQAAMRAAFHRDPLLLMTALRDLKEEAKRLGATSARSGELLARGV